MGREGEGRLQRPAFPQPAIICLTFLLGIVLELSFIAKTSQLKTQPAPPVLPFIKEGVLELGFRNPNSKFKRKDAIKNCPKQNTFFYIYR